MSSPSRILARYIISTVVVLLLVTTGSFIGVLWTSKAESENIARDTATTFANLVVSPMRTTDLGKSDSPDTRRQLDQAVEGLLEEGEVYRVKIWEITEAGTALIVYSDLPDNEGIEIPVSDNLQEAVATGDTVVIPIPDDEAHANEQIPGDNPVEVYLAFEDVDGALAVAELYLVNDPGERVRTILSYILPFVLGGPILLAALTLPLALRMSRSQVENEISRRELIEQSLSASEKERARLARLLHDGPVQDLAALGLMLDRDDGGETAARRVRDQIGRLRELLDDLSPSDLHITDLESALWSVVDQYPDLTANISIVSDPLDHLDDSTRATVFRCTAEVLRNALVHSDAESITVNVHSDEVHTEIHIHDDGRGFDPSAPTPDHYGLKLVQAAVADRGGTCEVSGSDGASVTMSIPTSI